jgi:hypothetical protein
MGLRVIAPHRAAAQRLHDQYNPPKSSRMRSHSSSLMYIPIFIGFFSKARLTNFVNVKDIVDIWPSPLSLPTAALRRLSQCHRERRMACSRRLYFDDLGEVTVADILADPARYEGETLADPTEQFENGYGPD